MLQTIVVHRSFPSSIPMSRGWGNGYVVIPEGHELYKCHYNYFDVKVHGGVTFSDTGENFKLRVLDFEEAKESTVKDNDWIIGFDTAHYGDSISKWPKESVITEAIALANRIENKEYTIYPPETEEN